MNVNCYHIDDECHLTPVNPEDIAESCKNKEATTWLDLEDYEAKELEPWLDDLGIRDLPRKLCLEGGERGGFYPLRNEIFFVVSALAEDSPSDEVVHVAFHCSENLLITLHHKPVLTLKKLSTERGAALIPERSIAGLVSALLMALSLRCILDTSDLNASMLVLEGRMEREADTIKRKEILEKRSELMAILTAVSDQLPSVRALAATDKPFFTLEEAKEDMACAVANLQSADRSLDRLDKRIAALRHGLQMHAQDKTNRRLGVLTVLSAIFLPISFLAAVYGMGGVEVMPESRVSLPSPIAALGVMALMAAAMFYFFRKIGLLD